MLRASRRNNFQTTQGYHDQAHEYGGVQMIKVLVVEDDKQLNHSVCAYLERSGYSAQGCLCANDAYNALYDGRFDLIVSDIMMPGIDGFAFAENVRRFNDGIPIIFMSAREDMASKERGFRLGVDDYLVKPFDLGELALRVAALLRRAHIAAEKRIQVGGLVLDGDAMSVTLDGSELPVTVREFNILFKLLQNPNHAFTRASLMEQFWDAGSDVGPRAVDVYITRLRDKLDGCPGFKILTVHGLGYKAVLTDE
jgi:DNA-binding response OmpR family regulator